MLKINRNNAKTALLLALLFFASMNFGAKFFYFVFAALGVTALLQGKLVIHRRALPYLCLGLLMAAYNHREGILSMLRCLAYVAFYLVGFNMVAVRQGEAHEEKGEKVVFSVLAAISLGSFTHYLLNYLTNLSADMGRNTLDIWSGAVMAATGQAVLSCLMLGFSVALVFLPPKRPWRWLALGSIALILAYNFVLAGRTLPVMLGLVALAALVYTWKTAAPAPRRKILAGLAVAVLLAVVLPRLGPVAQFLEGTNLFQRLEAGIGLQSGRLDAKWQFLTQGWRYPLGGLHLRQQFGHAHDLLLDGYDEYGLGGLVLLTVILINGISALWTAIRREGGSRSIKLALLCLYLAVLLAFCAEPILAGMPWLFTCFSLVNGCMDGLHLAERKE